MGKSRLAREIARDAHAHGAHALFGSCDEDSIAPYQPFTEAGRYYLSKCPVPGIDVSPLSRLVPELREQVTVHELPGAPETERYQLFEAVAQLVIKVAEERPLVLVLDDIHWGDKPTLLMLRHVFERTAGAPVLFVCTARELEAAQSEAFAEIVGPLRREPGFERIALSGFDEAEIASLVASHGDPSPGLVRRLREQTDGNPFFLEEMLRAAGGSLSEEALDRLPVPEGVKELISRRLSGLGEDAVGLLVLGRRRRPHDPGDGAGGALRRRSARGARGRDRGRPDGRGPRRQLLVHARAGPRGALREAERQPPRAPAQARRRGAREPRRRRTPSWRTTSTRRATSAGPRRRSSTRSRRPSRRRARSRTRRPRRTTGGRSSWRRRTATS